MSEKTRKYVLKPGFKHRDKAGNLVPPGTVLELTDAVAASLRERVEPYVEPEVMDFAAVLDTPTKAIVSVVVRTNSTADLARLLAAETAGKKRRAVIDAITGRVAALGGDDSKEG